MQFRYIRGCETKFCYRAIFKMPLVPWPSPLIQWQFFCGMAKNPVCPIYYNDLLQSTITWTDEEFGAYLRLLFYQWDKGSIPQDIVRIRRIAESVDRNWELIAQKFEVTESGLKNSVMESYRQNREKFLNHQKVNGRKGGRPINPNLTQTITQTITQIKAKKKPLEKENEYEKENIDKDEFEKEKTFFYNSGDRIFSFCNSKKITVLEFEKQARIFLTDIELKEDFKSCKELWKHFINWFNKNCSNGTAKSIKQKQSSALDNLIEVGQAEFAALRKKSAGA